MLFWDLFWDQIIIIADITSVFSVGKVIWTQIKGVFIDVLVCS